MDDPKPPPEEDEDEDDKERTMDGKKSEGVRYQKAIEKLYSGSPYDYSENPEVVLPKKWSFLKVETVIRRSRGWSSDRVPKMNSTEEVVSFLTEILKSLDRSDRERLYAIFIDEALRVLGIHEVTIGSSTGSMAPAKELFRAAIIAGACGIFFVHNHVSGELSFSKDDLRAIAKLVPLGDALDVTVHDFIAMGFNGEFVSASKEGIIHPPGMVSDPDEAT